MFLPLQSILDSAGPDPTHARCDSSVLARSLLEWQNLSPSCGSTESPLGSVWEHWFFKYIFFCLSFSLFSSGTLTTLILELLILFLGPTPPPPPPPPQRICSFYFSIFLPPQEWFISIDLSSNPLPLCIPALNFIWFLFVFPISLLRFSVFPFIKSIFKNKTIRQCYGSFKSLFHTCIISGLASVDCLSPKKWVTSPCFSTCWVILKFILDVVNFYFNGRLWVMLLINSSKECWSLCFSGQLRFAVKTTNSVLLT